MSIYEYVLRTKQSVEEGKAKSIFIYLTIVADQVGLKLIRKEPVCQEKSSVLPTPPEQFKG